MSRNPAAVVLGGRSGAVRPPRSPIYTGGKVLADNTELDEGRTAVPLVLDQIYSSLDRLNVALGPDGANANGALTDLLETTADNFGGQGEKFNETIKDFSTLTSTLDNKKEELFGSAEQLGKFIETLVDNDATVQRFNKSLGSVSTMLSGERQELAAALSNLAEALGQVGTFVRDNKYGDGWVVNGQKAWTSQAHTARFAILLARTDAEAVKHAGLTYFLCDMTDPGVDVRPLRQLTGEAEFNEVFMTAVRIPDSQRLGAVGAGWRVANTTLNNERVSIGRGADREGGMVGVVARTWRQHPELQTPELQDRLLRLWIDAEAARVTGNQLAQKLTSGQPGPEGSMMKLLFARTAQELSGLEVELLSEDGLRFSDWTLVRPTRVDNNGRDAGYRYLRAKGNSIEGGTSEIIRNIVAERVLGLPAEARNDKDRPWKELAK